MVSTALDGRGKRKALIKKIKDDITNALDKHRTGVEEEDVAVVHICIADNLSTIEDQKIRSAFSKHSHLLKIWNGDQISTLIYYHYPSLAKQYLSIQIGRKAILALPEYLERIGSAPESLLINPYVSPEIFPSAKEKFATNNILVISGGGGTGKTRLAVELLKQFALENQGAKNYCIRSNAAPSSDAIALDLAPGHNNLLIDDAGRETANLIRVLQHWQFHNTYVDKLILTTRDYSLQSVLNVLDEQQFKYHTLEVGSSSSDFIRKVIEEQGVTENADVERLTIIAKGRVRLAVMGSQALLSGMSGGEINAEQIYETFFKSIIKDKPELNNDNSQKLLAVLYFFKYIDFEDQASISNILERFNLEVDQIRKTANLLKASEFLDEYENIFRVGDQEIGFYHFFKVFIKDNSLKLETLLSNKDLQYTHQLNETIGQSFRVFEGSPSLDRIRPILEETYNNISDGDLRFNFLEVFGKEFQDLAYEECLRAVYSKPSVPEPTIFQVGDFTKHVSVWDRPKVVRFLKHTIEENQFSIDSYFDLYMEFVRRNPNRFDEFLHFLYSEFKPKDKDRSNKYQRLISVFAVLERHTSTRDALALTIVKALGAYWLSTAYPDALLQVRNNGKFVYQADSNYADVRKQLWKLLIHQLGKEIDVYKFLHDYTENFDVAEVVYHDVDSDHLKYCISTFLISTRLSHGVLMVRLSEKIDRYVKKNSWFKEQSEIFTNADVHIAEALMAEVDRRYSRSKGKAESQNSYDKRILKSVLPLLVDGITLGSFIKLYSIAEVIAPEQKDAYLKGLVYERLGAFLLTILDANPKEYLLSIEFIIARKNPLNLWIRQQGIEKLFKLNARYGQKLHVILNKEEYPVKDQVLLAYYYAVPKNEITAKHANGLKNLLRTRNTILWLDLKRFDKFKSFIANLAITLLQLSLARYKENGTQFHISHIKKEGLLSLCEDDLELAEGLYKMLVTGDLFYDKAGDLLAPIVRKRDRFLIELVSDVLRRKINIERGIGIATFLFDGSLKNAENLVHELIDIFIESSSFTDTFTDLLFYQLHQNTSSYTTAFNMILSYVRSNAGDAEKMRKVMKIVTEKFHPEWVIVMKEMLISGLDARSIQSFSFSQGVLRNANEIAGDRHRSQYEAILKGLIQSNMKEVSPERFQECINELNRAIRGARISARNERRREFMGHRW
jgi:hypothetical protein